MKKIITLLAIVLFSFSSFAQDLTNQFYFRVGYSSPSWSQYGLNEKLWKSEGLDSKTGATFEIGNIFMLKKILNSPNMSLGINADYLYINYGNFSGNDAGYEGYDFDINFGTLRLGSKIGPSFTYSPTDKIAIDVFVKADFAWATAAVIYEDEPGDAEDYYLGYTAIGVSTGLNFRFGLLILGIEFDTASPKLESDDYEGVYLQELLNDEFETSISDNKSNLPVMNFTIGLSF